MQKASILSVPRLVHRSRVAVSCLLLGLVVFGGVHSLRAEKYPGLDEHYRHWLTEEVNYIISDDERSIFLGLKTNADRDKFMASFWLARNPDPDSPVNTYEQEHYRRIAYADANFGARNLNDGWRSDRGMAYITLGPPQQRTPYYNAKYLRPMEIWFYQSPGPGLPPYFSLIFFKESFGDDYRLYSPYVDKPEKLIASTNAVNDEKKAFHIIDMDLGRDVARTTLSLVANSPVDTQNAIADMESDVLLSNIRNYRNLPLNKEIIEMRRAQLESVSHRVLLGNEYSTLAVVPSRDSRDMESLHYVFRFLRPEAITYGRDDSRRTYYSLTVRSELEDENGKPVYSDVREIKDYLSQPQAAHLNQTDLALEGRLPVVPGKYKLRVEVTNKINKEAYSETEPVVVPPYVGTLAISPVFFAQPTQPVRDPSGTNPFSFSGVQLAAAGSENALLYAGDPLRVLFQLWEQPGNPSALHGKQLNMHYTIGKLSTNERHEFEQVVDRGSFDADGNLLMGKDIATDDLHSGHYRLVLRVTDPETGQTAAQALDFELTGGDRTGVLTVVVPSFTDQADGAENRYRRGLAALSQGRAQEAILLLQSAITVDGTVPGYYSALSKAYRSAGNLDAAKAADQQLARLNSQSPAH